jgi:methionyl-tRNA formyltransferase
MFMDKGIDTGDILKISKTQIGENETAEELFERLSVITAELLTQTLRDVEQGKITPIKQNEEEATYAPIINKEMALIDFSKSAKDVFNAVRGFNSWPVAYCMLDEKRLKVFACKVEGNSNLPCGTVVNSEKMAVVCGDGKCIELTEIQLEGSKRMTAQEFLMGKKIPVGTVLIGGENRG